MMGRYATLKKEFEFLVKTYGFEICLKQKHGAYYFIDWTNHGYSNHGNPHVHYTTYNSQYRDGFTIRWD